MQISFNSNLDPVSKAGAPQHKAREAAVPGERAAFDRSEALDRSLGQAPAVRADRVEQAKVLAANVLYPPRETLRGIANLLAMNMGDDN